MKAAAIQMVSSTDVEVNCREHLQMLDSIEAGDLEIAAAQMRRHLQRASQLRRLAGAD